MSFANGELSAADVAAVTGNNGNGFLGNNDGGFWLLILFLFAMMGGWGNGNGAGNCNGNCANAAAIPAVQAGFDQAAVMGGINGLNSSITNGFANAELSRAGTQANLTGQLNSLAMSLQQCCCDNRASTADLKYTVATEACADRQAVSDGLRDVIVNNTANTQALMNTMTAGFQAVQDKFCQVEIDSLKQQLDTANRRADVSTILGGQQAIADQIENRINPPAIPAYQVASPYSYYNGAGCCNGNGSGCCGYAA